MNHIQSSQRTIRVCRYLASAACFVAGLFLIQVASQASTASTFAHPYHVSYAEVAFNAKSGKFEVAICVWPTDLEKALREQEERAIDLEKTDNLDPMMARYIQRKFLIRKTEATSKLDPSKTVVENASAKNTSKTSPTKTSQQRKRVGVSDTAVPPSDPDKETSAKRSPTTKNATSGADKEEESTRIRWVGHEFERRHVWLYFEVPGDANVSDWILENRCFHEFNEDQLNHIQWSIKPGQFETFVCTPQQSKHAISTLRLLQK